MERIITANCPIPGLPSSPPAASEPSCYDSPLTALWCPSSAIHGQYSLLRCTERITNSFSCRYAPFQYTHLTCLPSVLLWTARRKAQPCLAYGKFFAYCLHGLRHCIFYDVASQYITLYRIRRFLTNSCLHARPHDVCDPQEPLWELNRKPPSN